MAGDTAVMVDAGVLAVVDAEEVLCLCVQELVKIYMNIVRLNIIITGKYLKTTFLQKRIPQRPRKYHSRKSTQIFDRHVFARLPLGALAAVFVPVLFQLPFILLSGGSGPGQELLSRSGTSTQRTRARPTALRSRSARGAHLVSCQQVRS